jgi:hypothetical protein
MARLREEVLAERPEVAPTEIQPRIKTWSKEDALKAIENTVNQGKNGKAEITPVVKPPQNNEAVSLSKEPWEMTKEEITKVIDNTSLGKKYPPTPFQVDWGPRQRGQGKRVGGGMIVGGMSDAPRGIKTYSNLLGSVPEYKENPGEFRGFSQFDKIQYLKAREYGLNHNQAILYQAIHNPEFKNIADDKLQERMKFYSDKQQSPVTEPLPIDQTVKQAGFDSLGEAHLAFVAKEKGFKQFAQELGVKPSKESAAKFIELKKRLGSLPADVQNQLRIDLQLFSQSHKAATGKEMTWNDYLNKEKMDSLRANYRQRVADIQTKAKTEKKIAVNLATKKEVWRRLLNEKDAKIKYQGKIAELREKAKKQAEIAKKKGMWRQLLNKQDAEERHAKNKYIDKIKKVDAKHMRPEFQRPVKAILDEINLVAPSKKTANKLNRIAQYLETHPDNNIPQTTINKLKRLSRKNIRDMSLEEVETVYDAVYHYVHLNKLKNKLIFGRTYKDAEIVDNEAATNVINYRKSQNDPAVLKDEGGSSASPARKYFMLSKNMETLAEELDGSPNGVIKTVAYDGINEGVSKQIEFRRKVSGEIKNSFKDAGIVNKDILPWSEAFQVKKKNVQYKVYKLQNGQELTLTPAERIDLYLHNKSGDNMRHIFGGGLFKANDKYTRYKITQVDVDNILADMGDKEKQVAEAFSKVYNGIVKDGINKTSVELNGYEMATTPNYNPIKVNGMEIKHDPLKPRNPGYSAFSIEGMGILKERSGGKNGILIEDAFTKLFAHIEKSSAYVGLAKPLRNVKMLVAGRKMKWELGKIDAGFTARRFDNYIKDIEGSMIDIEDVDKLTLDLIHKIDTAILGINPWVIMKQPISYLMEANEISAKYLTQAVFSKGDLEEIKKYSPQLAERIEGDVTVELGELGKVGAVRHFFTGISPISSKLTEGIVWADNQTVGRTWNAVKKEVKAEHPELKGDAFFEAVAKRTEEIYRKTQSAFQPKDRSELGRSKSVWMRMMTRFTSQRNICFNAMIRARTQFNYSHKTIGDKAAYMGKLFNIIVVSSLAVGAVDRLRNAVYGRKQEGAIGTGIKTISDAMSYFYIVGDVFAAIIDKTQRGTFAGRDWSSPFMQTANNFIDTVADVNRAISQVLTQERYKSGPNSGEVKWKRTAAKATNETLAFVSKIKGLPYENIQRLLSKPVTALAQSPEDRRYNQLKVKYDEWYTQWKEGVKVRKSVPITKEAREFLGLKAKREQAKAIREAEAYKKMSAAR